MNTLIQAKLDFSIFILQFNFFNRCETSERCVFTHNAYFTHPPTFSSGQPEAECGGA